jgi:uncharacterized protein (DUF1800 family)
MDGAPKTALPRHIQVSQLPPLTAMIPSEVPASPGRRQWLRTITVACAGAGLALPDFAQETAVPGVVIPSGARVRRSETAIDAKALADHRWLSRVCFSADSGSTARLQQLGRKRFLDEQLAMPARDTPALVAAIAALPALATTTEASFRTYRAEQQRIKALPEGDVRQQAAKVLRRSGNELVRQAEQRQLWRAVMSPAQLREQMSWFWLNHFSIYGNKGAVRWMIPDYENVTVRPNALGRFRDLLMATLTAPAMLDYLDNIQSAAGHVNENYARELMELHTLGVSGGPSGSSYTQQDVQEMARVLTGVGIDRSGEPPRLPPALRSDLMTKGLFEFNPRRHDYGTKQVLGRTIAPAGFGEVEEAVDLLSKHPATARHLAIQLATYFVSDAPPHALIDQLADRFMRSDGDISEVLRALFLSPAMTEAVALPNAGKLKDPMVYVVSSIRLAQEGQPIVSVEPALNWLRQLGEPLYGRVTPDGYPLTEAAWASSGQIVRRFEIGRAIGSGRSALFGGFEPGSPVEAPKLDGAFFQTVLAPQLGAPTREALATAKSRAEWNTLLLASPEWMQR